MSHLHLLVEVVIKNLRTLQRSRCGLLGVLGALLCAACTSSTPVEGTIIAAADYKTIQQRGACAPGSKPGAAGATNRLKSADAIFYNVRTPLNYNPERAHPLLMIFPPAGMSAEKSESFTHMTTEATRRGFIVAYTSHRPISPEMAVKLAKVPQDIAATWCIDTKHVYATGHSDGGTVPHALAVLPETKGTVAGIAPSAAGFNRKDFEAYQCPVPMPIMIMHNRGDMLFPGWGKETATWWAACNRCDTTKPAVLQSNGCVAYQGCAALGPTVYCEKSGSHMDWQGLGNDIVHFFEAAARRPD
ncbi:MAG: poly(3-hydroxybutyrate) depolymerase [Rugosibacter sp.]|nr:poly(3-hydroxybutyrate) depolymerase [Rugosibacter sp.]